MENNETKEIISNLKKQIPDVEEHILKSVTNCQVDTMISYKKDGKIYSFLDKFDNKDN